MSKSIQVLYMMCLLLLGSISLYAQSPTYEDFYNILPGDSVIVTLPKYSNSFFYTKDARYGSTDQLLSTGQDFIIRYKPDNGHFGLDTFQVVYFYPNTASGELFKKSKKVIIKTSGFILHSDEYTVYTSDTSVDLDVLANDLIPGGGGQITSLPDTGSASLSINSDGSKITYHGCNKAVSERLSYQVTKDGQKELGYFRLNVIDSTLASQSTQYYKFLVKNSVSEFSHPYTVIRTVKPVVHGTLNISGFRYQYQPDEGYTGSDTLEIEVGKTGDIAVHRFVFKIFDAQTPNILVADDYFYSIKGQNVTCDLLDNDFDMILNVTVEILPEHGTLVKLANGIYRYTPDQGFEGVDVFVYKACDLASDVCEFGTATVTVSNFEPEGLYHLYTAKGSPLKVNYPFPAPGYKLSIVTSAYPKHATAYVVDNQRNLIYNPSQDYVGLDSMKIKYTLIGNPSVSYTVKLYIHIYDIQATCFENCVWPGDHNNDGRVDMKDLTFIAPFIGQSGAARIDPPNDYWVGQDASDWDLSSGNVNLKYGDGDGDGIVLAQDTVMMNQNYRNLHGVWVSKGVNSLFLPFDLRSDKDLYVPGDPIEITFSIGDESLPVLDLAGFTASFSFSEAFNDASLTAEYKPSYWLTDGDRMLQMAKKPTVRNIDFGAGRLSGKGTAGYGDIAIIKGIVEEELEGFRDDDGIYYARIEINDATLRMGDGRELRTAPQTFYFPVKIARKDSDSAQRMVNLYPNPTTGSIQVKTNNPDNIINSYYIYSISGQNILSKEKINQNKIEINLGNYPAGLYLVKTFTTTGVEINKIEKL